MRCINSKTFFHRFYKLKKGHIIYTVHFEISDIKNWKNPFSKSLLHRRTSYFILTGILTSNQFEIIPPPLRFRPPWKLFIGRRSQILWLLILKFLVKWRVTFFAEEKRVTLSIKNLVTNIGRTVNITIGLFIFAFIWVLFDTQALKE